MPHEQDPDDWRDEQQDRMMSGDLEARRRLLRTMTFDEWQDQCNREAYQDYVDECHHRDCTPQSYARWLDNYEPKDPPGFEGGFCENH